MNLRSAILGAAMTGWGLLTAGCATSPAQVRIQGVAVAASLFETAENGAADRSQAEACLSLSKKLWERDVLESLRFLRRGAELRDAECCRQYLAHTETASVTLSQRVYARLFIEGLIRKGALLGRSGQDMRGELYYQLCWAWSCTEPRSPAKAKQVLESMLDSGLATEQAKSAFIVQMIRETGLRATGAHSQEIQLYAGKSADEIKQWLQVSFAGDRRETSDWVLFEADAWGGGNDRLILRTNVLAFLVNSQGEPSFRGTQLWICNLGTMPVYVTSLATAQSNRELLPGEEDVVSLASAELVTGIPLSIRHRRVSQ